MSRRSALYTRVLVIMTSLLLGAFAFIIYVMPSKVTITLSYRIGGVSGLVVENSNLLKNDKEFKIDANKPASEKNIYTNIHKSKFTEMFGYKFKAWYVNANLQLAPTTTFTKATTLYGIVESYTFRVVYDLTGNGGGTVGGEPTGYFDFNEYGFTRDAGNSRKFYKDYVFGQDEMISLPSKDADGNYLFRQGDLSLDGKVLDKWVVTFGGKEARINSGDSLSEIMADSTFIRFNPENPDAPDSTYNKDNHELDALNIYLGSFVFTPTWAEQKANVQFNYGLNQEEQESEDKQFNIEINRGLIGQNLIPITTESDLVEMFGEAYRHKEFVGWYADKSYEIPYNFETSEFYEDTKLYAKFINKIYSVEFDFGDPAIYDIRDSEKVRFEKQEYEYDDLSISNKAYKPATPFLVDYKFENWYLPVYDSDGNEMFAENGDRILEVQAYDFDTPITRNIVLYAKWNTEVDENGNIAYFNYSKSESNKTIKITGVNDFYNNLLAYVIPAKATLDGVEYTVTEIGEKVFRSARTISITIPSTVTTIHNKAFDMGGIESNLRSIFVSTKNSKYRDIDGVLYTLDGKKLIYYPSGKESDNLIIGDRGYETEEVLGYAFYNARLLKSVTINVKKVEGFAFYNDIGKSILESVIIGSKLETLGDGVFAGNSMLTSVSVVVDNKKFAFNNTRGVLTDVGSAKSIYYYLESRIEKEFAVASSELFIRPYAFYNSKLETVNISRTQQVDNNAFLNSVLLKNIVISSNNSLNFINDNAFGGLVSLETIDFRNANESLSIQGAIFRNSSNLKSVYFPNNNMTVVANVFDGADGIENIYVYRDTNADRVLSANASYVSKIRYLD